MNCPNCDQPMNLEGTPQFIHQTKPTRPAAVLSDGVAITLGRDAKDGMYNSSRCLAVEQQHN